MKKLEKKSGRRANRKRQRMERLLEEVAPEREGSGLLASVSAPRNSSTADNSGSSRNSVKHDDLRRTDTPADSESAEVQSSDSKSGNSQRLLQNDSSDSRRDASRRRRMRRIKEELRLQAIEDNRPRVSGRNAPSVLNTKKPSATDSRTSNQDIAQSAADTVRQIAEAPKSDADPTARSMVAIAGAVTALASAIQFRLTDPAETNDPKPETPSDSKAKSAVAATIVQEATVEQSRDVEGSRQSTEPSVSNSTKKAAVAAKLSPATVPDDDEDSGFADSFFDDDESDIAGAYTVLPPAAAPVESYRDWFRRVVVRNKWMTWFTAFYVHWLIILVMMMVFVHGPNQAANLLLNGAFADTPEIEPETFDMSVAEPVMQPESKAETAATAPVAIPKTFSEMAEESLAISDSILQQIGEQESSDAGDITSEDTSAEQSHSPPATPPGSVSEGSFSVWTEPEYPNPGEPYRIIVQIQLPPKTKSYHLRDINGVVVGSDGYRKPIPGANQGPLPIVDGCVRLVIPIVSADENVKDTIFIRSKLLKETQKLLIEF